MPGRAQPDSQSVDDGMPFADWWLQLMFLLALDDRDQIELLEAPGVYERLSETAATLMAGLAERGLRATTLREVLASRPTDARASIPRGVWARVTD